MSSFSITELGRALFSKANLKQRISDSSLSLSLHIPLHKVLLVEREERVRGTDTGAI